MSDCIDVDRLKTKDGYGVAWVPEKQTQPARSPSSPWPLRSGGKPSKASSVNHQCDNPSCVNVEHLYVGTHSRTTCATRQSKRRMVGGHRRTRLTAGRRSMDTRPA